MSEVKTSGKVVSLDAFRKKKTIEDHLSRGRTPLYMSHLEGKVSSPPAFRKSQASDFGDRLQRIKTSLERINRLMAEIKANSNRRTDKSKH